MRRTYPRLAADSGRIALNPDLPVGELRLALFNVPGKFANEGSVLLASSTSTPGWRWQRVEISHAGRYQVVRTAPRKSVLGHIDTSLSEESDATVEMVLHDKEQWLLSCTDADLALGDNLAFVGDEVIAFGEARSVGNGRFRLARLRRGQFGTQASNHAKGEPFVLIQRDALQPVFLPASAVGTAVRASAQNGAAECSIILAEEASARSKRTLVPACPSRKRQGGS